VLIYYKQVRYAFTAVVRCIVKQAVFMGRLGSIQGIKVQYIRNLIFHVMIKSGFAKREGGYITV
jgi:hypothetical protein